MRDYIFSRGWLTDMLLEKLEPLEPVILIGDGIAPEPGGWTGDQPGNGDFISYVTVGTLPARKRAEGAGRQNTSWTAQYSLHHVGALRQQADWTADKVREAMIEIDKASFSVGLPGWKLIQIEYVALGAVTRNSSVDPPYWEVTDQVDLWLERDR